MHKFDYFILSTSVIFLLLKTMIFIRVVRGAVDCESTDNPCSNGGQCTRGLNRCLCTAGYSGETCQFVEPEVKCLGDRIEVHIQRIWAEHYAKVTSAAQLYMGSKNAENEQCQAVPHPHDPSQFVITVNGLSSCGTSISRDNETQDFVYSNAVYSNRFNNLQLGNNVGADPAVGVMKSQLFITRLPSLQLMSLVHWTCYYQHKYRVTSVDGIDSVEQLMEQQALVPSALLPRSGAQVAIDTYGKPFWTAENRMHQRSYKKIANGASLYFEIAVSAAVSQTAPNFLVQECALVNRAGPKAENLRHARYHEKVLITSGGCTMTPSKLPVTTVITDSVDKFRFAVMMLRDDWLEVGYEDMDPTVYIHCVLQEQDAERVSHAQNSCNEDYISNDYTRESAGSVVEIEAGPFQIQRFISEEEARSIDLEGGDEEHSMDDDETSTRPRSSNSPHPVEMIYRILNSLENDAGETREDAWDKMKDVLSRYENEEYTAEPMIALKSSFALTQDMYTNENKDQLPVFHVTSVKEIEQDIAQGTQKIQTMVILAIVIGVVFCSLIITPVVIACYKNRGGKAGDGKTAKGKKTSEYPRVPVQTALETMRKDDGLQVDHELYFVEYADNVHDLVWGQNQQEQAGWIKNQSLDAQSIDISTSKPYDKKFESAATPPPRVVLPSYVVFNKDANKPQAEQETLSPYKATHPRRGSIKLAGITIFSSCSGSKITNVPYKFKEKTQKARRNHV